MTYNCWSAALSVRVLLAMVACSLVPRFAFRACTLPRLSHEIQVLCWRFFGLSIAPRGSKSDSDYFFSAPRASKSVPRGFQEAFRGLPHRRCDWQPVWGPFLASKKSAWDPLSKISNIRTPLRTLCFFASAPVKPAQTPRETYTLRCDLYRGKQLKTISNQLTIT